MNCKKIEENIDAYVDGELLESVEMFESHLKTCESCRTIYEETLEVKTMLNDLELVELPDDFEETLHLKLVNANVIPFYKKSIVKKLGFVSSIAAVGVIAFMSGLQVKDGFDLNLSDDDSNYANERAAMVMESDVNGNLKANFTTASEESLEAETKITMRDEEDYGEASNDVFDEPVVSTITNSVSIQFNESIIEDGIDVYYYQVVKISTIDELIVFLESYEISNLNVSEEQIVSFNIEYEYYEDLIYQLSKVIEIFQEVNVDLNKDDSSSLVKIVIEIKED